MNSRRIQFTTRSWFQWWVLPAIVLVTLGLSWSVYRSLRDVILRGFDQKLVAVSTVTAAFIDPGDHAELMYQPKIEGLTVVSNDLILALDTERNVLMRIAAANGAAAPLPIPVEPGLSQLAYDAAGARLLALDRQNSRIVVLDPETGRTEVLLDLDRTGDASALAATPSGRVYVLGNRLHEIATGATRARAIGVNELPPVLTAAYHPRQDRIVALTQDLRLLLIDPQSGKPSPGPALSTDQPVHALMYHPGHDMLWAAGAELHAVDPLTGEVTPAEVLPAFGKELSPTYRRYLGGMRRIMDLLDLTYVYTQVVTDGSRITYGLDATQGEDHSPLHSQDELPAEQIAGVEQLMRNGTVYSGPVQQWQQWGLIKSAFAPIVDATGRSIAMAGADVDVSLIDQRTRGALFQLLIVGALSLVLATAVSFAIADRLRRPLASIKSTALEVAAGNHQGRAEVAAPRETHVLAVTFNKVASALEASIAALHSSIAELLRSRDRNELARRLSQPHEPTRVLREVQGVRATWRDMLRSIEHASGAVRLGDRAVLWLAEAPADRLEAARRRAELALRVAARMSAEPSTGSALPLPGHTVAPFGTTHTTAELPAGVRLVIEIDAKRRVARVLRGPGAPAVEALPGGARQVTDGELTVELSGFDVEVINS